MPGDVIQQLDGTAVDDLVGQWKPFYAASNESARLRDIGDFTTRGSCGPAAIVARRADATLNITASRVPASTPYTDFHTHDLPGDTFQMLSNDVAYLKLSSATVANSAAYIRAAAETKGLIIDMRNSPAEFVIDSWVRCWSPSPSISRGPRTAIRRIRARFIRWRCWGSAIYSADSKILIAAGQDLARQHAAGHFDSAAAALHRQGGDSGR
jgi:hypothetical protein